MLRCECPGNNLPAEADNVIYRLQHARRVFKRKTIAPETRGRLAKKRKPPTLARRGLFLVTLIESTNSNYLAITGKYMA